jgi:hypothetical protein
MRCRVWLTLMLLLGTVDAAAQPHDGLTMTCRIPRKGHEGIYGLVPQASAEETSRLGKAPHGAKRTTPHRLEVAWRGGKRYFVDKPPYNEPLDGVSWSYCGFDATLGVHLVFKNDKDVATGVLLDDRTGELLLGGEVVLFSPDQKYYLAYEQPDGQDGETIRLRRRSGTLVWKGYNGLLMADGITFLAEFVNMRWNDQDRLQAEARMDEGKTVTVTLTERGDGKREWLPHVEGSAR